ncbi:MAG TPA: hypothetical protein VIF81_02705 [Pyrinomonadaceae bacterium]
MKKTYAMVTLLALVAVMTVTAAAQSSSNAKIRVHIPFEFNVGDKILPAGEYSIRQVNPSSDLAVLEIANRNRVAAALVRAQSVYTAAANRSTLTFRRCGSQYFFARAAIEGMTEAWQAPKSRAERGVERELALVNSKAEAVVIAAR